MKQPKNYISETAAIENLRRFFAGSPNSDRLTLNEVFDATGRHTETAQTNRNWLANKMTQLKYYDLIHPVYKYGERKELAAIQLSLKGKEVLGRISPILSGTLGDPLLLQSNHQGVNTSDVAAAVREFRNNYPEFDVHFDIRLKKI